MQLENMLLKHVLLLNFFPENILLYESMPVLNSLSTYTGKREITLFFVHSFAVYLFSLIPTNYDYLPFMIDMFTS